MNQTETIKTDKTGQLILIALVVVTGAVLVSMLHGLYDFGVDDSFIYYRYVENLAAGQGFVFNAGEPAGEGFTSWVWLLLLTLCHYCGMDVIAASKILGIVFHLAAGLLVYLAARRLLTGEQGSENHGKLNPGESNHAALNRSRVAAAIPAALVLVNFRLTAHSVSGMETSLYVFSIVGLVYLTLRALTADPWSDRWWLILSLATTVLFFVRPEGIAAGGLSLAALALKRPRDLLRLGPWRCMIAGLVLPLLLFVAWRIAIFGHPLPLSYYHKRNRLGLEYNESLRHFWRFLKTHWPMILVGTAVVIRKIFRRAPRAVYLYLAVCFFAMISVYLFFYPAMNYLHRFYIPYFPLLLIMTAPGILEIFTRTAGKARVVRVVLLVAVTALLAVAGNLNHEKGRFRVQSWSRMVDPAFSRARLGVIMARLPRDLVAANSEMGVIPYYSGLTCLDMAGLTDPHIAHNGVTMDYLTQRNADLIIFNREVEKVTPKEWDTYTLNYKDVFLSRRFKDRFVLVGSFAAWPGGKKKYYLYADQTSPQFPAIKQWTREFAGELGNKKGNKKANKKGKQT